VIEGDQKFGLSSTRTTSFQPPDAPAVARHRVIKCGMTRRAREKDEPCDRNDFPDFQCAKPGLDVDTGEVMGLSVDAQAGSTPASVGRLPPHIRCPARIGGVDCSICIGCGGFNKATRKMFH